MKTKQQHRCARTAMALAMAAAFGAAYADDAAVRDLTQPQSFVSVGAAGLSGDSKDRSLFGQYNGLRKDDAYLLLDFGYVKRDEATGTWTVVEGRNLGLESRELRGLFGPQGNWKIYGEYWENVRREPRTVNTSLDGAGTTTPIVSRLGAIGTGNDLDLKLERKRLGLGGEKWITPNLLFELSFQNEDKDGARIFGRGFNCPSGAAPTPVCTALATGANQWAILFLPEPVNSTTQQWEAKLNYNTDRFALTAGYYGSFYKNDNGSLVPTINGNLNNPLGNPMGTGGGVALMTGLRNILQLPMSLPPDNQANQFSLAGNYRITPTTIATFKYAYTHATQHEDWGSVGLSGAPGGRSNLDGRLDTTLAQAGVSARPLPKLQVLANVKYEDRDDKTPIELYNIEGTNTFTNGHISNTKVNGKLEASYTLPANWRVTAGLDYESIDRGDFVQTDEVAGLTALRRKVYDRGYRVELRKSMSDSLNGFLSYVHTQRDGSSWLKPLGNPPGVLPSDPDCTSATVAGVPNACIFSRTGIFPYMLENRDRDKVRALVDWSPADRVSVQFAVDYGKDKYDDNPTEKGLRNSDVKLYSVDASYALNDAWRVSGYLSYGEQTLRVAHSTGYIADLRDKNTTAGIGVKGIVSPRISLGADLLYIRDRNVYDQTLDAQASASNVAFLAQSGGLPDVVFRDTRFKVYGAYALQKNADVRLEVVHDRTKLDEWTWGANGVAFAFSDNTTVNLRPNQNVTFVALTYTYRFR
ncbi:MAG TPA: MtrB/PioB family decaheme-associated outer membrane protein [Usitatibacter sp.]|nr:MtrB/PioB family decaheme-associated outer membrane protein [Usitatibacter sp.]